MKKVFSSLFNLLPEDIAYAHCDAPCGIYETHSAQTAANTVLKMVEKIEALPKDQSAWTVSERANFVRYIWTKEEHARKCKQELLVLWTDYFKPEHLEKYPELHDKFWRAAKLCSKVKQEVSKDSAQALVDAVHDISHMFDESKVTK